MSARQDVDPSINLKWNALGKRQRPFTPPGRAAILVDRIMTYTRPDKMEYVEPHIDRRQGGIILSGSNAYAGIRDLKASNPDIVAAIDPAAYEKNTATKDEPFDLPEGIFATTLGSHLDAQREAGAPVALTPTKFIPPGGSDILKAAAKQAKDSKRDDTVFVAPLHVSFLGPAFVRQTVAILADIQMPVALVMGGEFDPLARSTKLIPELRTLAATLALMPMRTDFNAFDLVAHGAFAGAIGTGGSLRHADEEPGHRRSFNPRDPSPSVLMPDLMSWKRGSKIAELWGARPTTVPRCFCRACNGQRLSRFLHKDQQGEAIAHAVASWTPRAVDMLNAACLQDRASYWRRICEEAVHMHEVFRLQLQLMKSKDLRPQAPLKQWATLPAWPTEATVSV